MKNLFKMTRGAALRPEKEKTALFRSRLPEAAGMDAAALLELLGSTAGGLDEATVRLSREEHGANVLPHRKKEPLFRRLFGAFINPFTVVLLALAVISVFTEIIFAAPGDESYATVLIITAMVLISGALRFVQETRSGNVAARLSSMLHTTACVERACRREEIPLEEIVVGDVVHLCAGDMIPADVRILAAKDLFVSQSALTGESEPVEKSGGPAAADGALTDTPNLAFLGSNVISGSATAVVLSVGSDTMLGALARQVDESRPRPPLRKV